MPAAKSKIRKTLKRTFIIVMALYFATFAYVRFYSANSGFNTVKHGDITYYYTRAVTSIYQVNLILLNMHWPLMKMDGLLQNRNVVVIHHSRFLRVHSISG